MILRAHTASVNRSKAMPAAPLHNEDERGATLVMVAISLVVLLGMGALAVDLAAGFAWRAEAQKIADSGALAGGSAFLDLPDAQAPDEATERAYEYALRHTIKGEPVDSSEVTVQVVPDDRLVRVQIRREGMPVWFSRVLGWESIDISAVAAAQAVAASTARCLKPIALPDLWDDADQDTNEDELWNEGEEWGFGSSPDDKYVRYDGSNEGVATGYGSDHRGGDYGRRIQIKAADPQSTLNAAPGLFYPWRLPPDPEMGECDKGGSGGNDAGGANYRRNLCECNASQIDLFDTAYDLEPGNMIGPTYQGINELIDEANADGEVTWDDTAGPEGLGGPVRPRSAAEGGGYEYLGTNTSRVIKVALFDPTQIDGSGMQSITFNNFALLFLEEQTSPQAPVMARFMWYASGDGSDEGPEEGSLVRYLRLVE
jgi:hypothetical protein